MKQHVHARCATSAAPVGHAAAHHLRASSRGAGSDQVDMGGVGTPHEGGHRCGAKKTIAEALLVWSVPPTPSTNTTAVT